MTRFRSSVALLSAALAGVVASASAALGQDYSNPYPAQAADPNMQYGQPAGAFGAQGSYAVNPNPGSQYPSQQYGSNPYGQQESTYYGYAADLTQQQAQQQQAPYQQQPYPQQQQQGYTNQQQYSQQPVYGQQAPPSQAQQPANLDQFLDNSDKNQPAAHSGNGNAAKLMHAGGALAKVGASMATGYFMGKAMQKQAKNMGYPGTGMPMNGMMGGMAGYPGGYGYPGYGAYPGSYGMPMGYGSPMGYGMPMGNPMGGVSPLGMSVMSGLNSLINK